MICTHFESGTCHSCNWLSKPYLQQLSDKEQHLAHQLEGLNYHSAEFLAPVLSPLQYFRNKAKMVVSGSVERPILGALADRQDPQSGVDLCDCPLYSPQFSSLFPILKDFIARAGLVPYNLVKQRGELKYILLTESQWTHKVMLRFVLRSESKLALIRRELDGLLAKLPQLETVSVNIQPLHAAVLEGEKEIFLTENQFLSENFNQIPLFIRPQGFFQTNPQVAQQLYLSAQQWILALNKPIVRLWDLFCGVGGFGLHCTVALQQKFPNKTIKLTGIEISPSAIKAATKSARCLGLKNVSFHSLDAAAITQNEQDAIPDLVIVNPPRRGIGQELVQFLNKIRPHFILYSSCHSVSMARDLGGLQGYKALKIQLFDMFPHTPHYEVLTLLQRDST
ncbi:23S rRNA (uracil(747)-C(5))-methyltransferase RlmC [Rodentibacter caecimuris]|uniref:23S rRNA (uracil(747)-C(5))-methyltransferase RlmC n=1 Tax=Rodentibacter caecimuris TaxID=1796644 RepID=A0ABX3KZP6_9PAST|nr:23S rRNA (uracil(747)-C(5))-methyltransferase [Rodentibacter heylii]